MILNRVDDAFNRAESEALADLKAKQADLLMHIRPKKSGNSLIAVFADGAEAIADQVTAAEARLKQVTSDRDEYKRLTGEGGINSLVNQIARMGREISDADLFARREVERAIRDNAGLDVRAAEELPYVQAAYQKRDAKEADYNPKIAALRDKIESAKKILEKYQ